MSAVSLNVFINNIDCMVNKYYDTYHKAIKKTSLMLRQLHIMILILKLIIKILDFKSQIQNVKIFQLKLALQIGWRNFLLSAKFKIKYIRQVFLGTLIVKKLLEQFMKKNFEKQIKQSLELKKQ